MSDLNGVVPPDGVEPSDAPLAPEAAEPEAVASSEPEAGESESNKTGA